MLSGKAAGSCKAVTMKLHRLAQTDPHHHPPLFPVREPSRVADRILLEDTDMILPVK